MWRWLFSLLDRTWYVFRVRRFVRGITMNPDQMDAKQALTAELLARPPGIGVATTLTRPGSAPIFTALAKLPTGYDASRLTPEHPLRHGIFTNLYDTGPLLVLSFWFADDKTVLTHYFFNPMDENDRFILEAYINGATLEQYFFQADEPVAMYQVFVDENAKKNLRADLAECDRFAANVPTDLVNVAASIQQWMTTVGVMLAGQV